MLAKVLHLNKKEIRVEKMKPGIPVWHLVLIKVIIQYKSQDKWSWKLKHVEHIVSNVVFISEESGTKCLTVILITRTEVLQTTSWKRLWIIELFHLNIHLVDSVYAINLLMILNGAYLGQKERMYVYCHSTVPIFFPWPLTS